MSAWSDKRRELVLKLWKDGWSASQIATRLGGDVTRNAVIGLIHRSGAQKGLVLRPRASGCTPVTGERLERAKTLFLEGKNGAEIAEDLGSTSKSAVNHALRKAGLNREEREATALEVVKFARPKPAVAGSGAIFVQTASPPPRVTTSKSAWRPLEGSEPVNLMQLGSNMCKWPVELAGVSEHMFCGCRTPDIAPYCIVHEEAERERAKAQNAQPLTLSAKAVTRMSSRVAA